jgi:8-oxo-dGTP diphosphatase
MYPFNVRVYGILINDAGEVLISDEQEYGMRFTKFPGGGLEFGEGLIDGLKREFVEECNINVDVISHFYTTDVYYLVKNIDRINFTIKTVVFDFDGDGDVLQAFRWVKLTDLNPDNFIFPTDKRVVELLINNI